MNYSTPTTVSTKNLWLMELADDYRVQQERRKVAEALRKYSLTLADLPLDFDQDFEPSTRAERDRILHAVITKAVNEREASTRKPAMTSTERSRRHRAKKPKPVRKPPMTVAERVRNHRARKAKAASM